MGSNSHEDVGPEEGSSRRSSWKIDSQKKSDQHEGIEEESDWTNQDEDDQDEDDQDEDDQDEDDQDEGDVRGGPGVGRAIANFRRRAPESLDETFTIYEAREFLEWAVADKVYFSPIDEWEQKLMSALHHIFRRLFDDRLVFPRLPGLYRVLECGFGTGEWATAVASTHPYCKVIALDISPYTLARSHPRVSFGYANLNKRMPFKKKYFDFAHSQMMAGAINAQRWPSFIGEMYRALRPGGWCQLVELYPNAQSHNGRLTDGKLAPSPHAGAGSEHALRQWSTSYLAGSESTGKDYRVYRRLSQMLVDSGFVDVEEVMLPLPLCAWRDDEAGRHLGGLVAAAVDGWLESLSLYPMTAVNGMPMTAWRELVDRAVAEARTPSLKPYFPIFVTIGRRPGGWG
ncbi:UMTA methyltransferase [Moelleriella libera RCEF 2490]|uniref:UMTA methyltransferase n=1 Tax=Moelleriella libera RCEF 2490 TaxID=1081109 RepID=A0A166U3M0_9HYPO|nr:UMTA methyltransferase [Moelleriella libera RCEF 2490]